jgi:hypothetical protein
MHLSLLLQRYILTMLVGLTYDLHSDHLEQPDVSEAGVFN